MFSPAGATATANPYIGVAVGSTARAQGSVVTHSDSVGYQFARDTNNAVDFPERAGFRLTDEGVLEFRNDPDDDTERWLPMTDPKVVLITNLTLTPLATPRQVELYTYCACLVKLTCTAADWGNSSSRFIAAGISFFPVAQLRGGTSQASVGPHGRTGWRFLACRRMGKRSELSLHQWDTVPPGAQRRASGMPIS